MTPEEDRVLLARIDERVEHIEKWCYNHDDHHRKYTYFALSTSIGLVVTLIVLILKLV